MKRTDAVMRATLRVSGNWSHPGELIERMPAGFRLTPEALILPDRTEIEFTPMPPDDQFAQIFKSSCRLRRLLSIIGEESSPSPDRYLSCLHGTSSS
jgi:hypothetical protein